jgi:ribosomal protein S18 acetylase RimI-like enzyme
VSLDADALAEMARNRGLKLVRSRVRTPGKAGYGMFGLTDKDGAAVFGIKGKALTASADEIADYLRGAEASDWKASLKQVGAKARKRSKAPASPPPEPEAKPQAEPEPAPEMREANADDAEQLAKLFALLGAHIGPQAILRNLRTLTEAGESVVVIARGKELLGACGLYRTVSAHREQPVGRITVLVVADGVRGCGLGRQLVEEAERRFAELGCELLEVTSNDRLTEAHAFYRHLGYERTSMRFAKPLASG